MKRIFNYFIVIIMALVLSGCTPAAPDSHVVNEPFDSFGMPVIELYLSDIDIQKEGIYNTMEEVGAYIYTFHALPSNYKPKSQFSRHDYTKENKLSTGGDVFYNREGLLPSAAKRSFTECDIGYTGGSRNALRIVYSSDWLIFYTSDHYASFSILRFYENVA